MEAEDSNKETGLLADYSIPDPFDHWTNREAICIAIMVKLISTVRSE